MPPTPRQPQSRCDQPRRTEKIGVKECKKSARNNIFNRVRIYYEELKTNVIKMNSCKNAQSSYTPFLYGEISSFIL